MTYLNMILLNSYFNIYLIYKIYKLIINYESSLDLKEIYNF